MKMTLYVLICLFIVANQSVAAKRKGNEEGIELDKTSDVLIKKLFKNFDSHLESSENVIVAAKRSQEATEINQAKKGDLMKNLKKYNTDTIYIEPSDNVEVEFGISLTCAWPSSTPNVIEIAAWERMIWTDTRLQWDPADYNGISTLRMPSYNFWVPDIRLYNSLQSDDHRAYVNAVLTSTGQIIWIPPVTYQIWCPSTKPGHYDCTLRFGSWTYDDSRLNLTTSDSPNENDPNTIDILQYYSACPRILDVTSRRDTVHYEGLPEAYTSFNIGFKLDATGQPNTPQ